MVLLRHDRFIDYQYRNDYDGMGNLATAWRAAALVAACPNCAVGCIGGYWLATWYSARLYALADCVKRYWSLGGTGCLVELNKYARTTKGIIVDYATGA